MSEQVCAECLSPQPRYPVTMLRCPTCGDMQRGGDDAVADLLTAARRVLAKLDDETAAVTMLDAERLREAIAKAGGL